MKNIIMKDQAEKAWIKKVDECEQHWSKEAENHSILVKLATGISLFVLIIMLILPFVPTSKADGIDDPNFYHDYNTDPCKYTDIYPGHACIPPLPPIKDRQNNHSYYLVPLPNTYQQPHQHGQSSPHQTIPEPTKILLLGTGLVAIFMAREKFQ